MELENMDFNTAKKLVQKIDKERATYYNRFTNQIWGDKKNYDFAIDSGKLGIEKTIDLLEKYIKASIKQRQHISFFVAKEFFRSIILCAMVIIL